MADAGKDADGLTVKQRAFVVEYLSNGRNATAAYRKAYDTGKMTSASVSRTAFDLLNHRKVASIIEKSNQTASVQLEKTIIKHAISKERIAEELAALAFASAEQLGAWTAAGSVKLADKRQALIDLARLMGYVIEKRDVRTVKSLEDLTSEELAALVTDGARADERGTRH